MIVKPGPVIDFLMFNQNVNHPGHIDWAKVMKCFSHLAVAHATHIFNCLKLPTYCKQAKRTLKNLRIKASTSNMEYKITGLSDLRCKDQT